MNRELTQNAKKFNFLEKLQINSFVDAIDENRWKVAKIVSFKNVGHRHSIRLHFDGFSNGWDEDFDLPASSKLAAFRRFTFPYTGPSENQTIHRPFQPPIFQGPLADLKKLTRQDKDKLKPEFIIQNYRGELFILVDTLLTQLYKYKPEEYDLTIRFLQAYIQTGIHVLKYSLDKIGEVSKQNINDPNVIYVNPVHALISSIPQILFNFNSMVSSKQRRVKLFQFGDAQPEESRKKIKNFLKSKQIVQICRNILEFQTPPYRGFPWAIKKEALILLSGLQEPIELKIVDNREIPEALDVLGYLRAKQAFSEQTIQNIHIELIITLIMSGNFQGKLKGLAELKRICDSPIVLKKQIIKQKIITPTLLSYLTDNSTFNGQIFKRSLPLFQTAAKLDLLTDDILKRITNLHKDKHQLEVKSYYETLAEFGAFIPEKKIVPFFEQVKKIPLSIDSISLIKQFTFHVIKNHPVYRKKYMSEESGGLGLVYLWEIIKQNNHPQLVSDAIIAFSGLAGDLYYRQVIQKYLIECFTNIKAGKNVENSLKIIHSSLNKNREIVNLVENIDKQFNIIDTLVKSLIEAEALSSKTIESVFEFVEEVNQYARKKITVDHMKDLWHLKECHTNLLKFMRKYSVVSKDKSHEKIILKKLSTTQIKEIFVKIFMNKSLMGNYINCDEQLFKTVDELLISFNHRNKIIDYNFKHCIRCINPMQLFGIDIFLDISLNCKDDTIVKKALVRFVEYYLRPYRSKLGSSKLDKVGFWLQCSERLTKYLQNSPQKYVSYSILFEQIKGRMKSINIMDPSESVFTVLAKESNIRKIISLPKNASLWRLREVINQQFKFNNTNFEIYVTQKRNTTDMQTQQDFSVLYLDAAKDPTTVAIIVSESKDPHPHFIAIDDFRANFSNLYAQRIYDSINTIKSYDIQLVALEILLKIPLLKSLQSKIVKLEINKQVTWDQIIDAECRPKLCYQIHTINKVKSASWISNFIKKGGVEHIQKILRQRSSSKVSLNVRDYEILSQLLVFFNQSIKLYRVSMQPNLPFNEASVVEIIKLSSKDKSNPKLLEQTAFLDYFYQTFNSLQQMITRYSFDGQKILTTPNVQEVLQLLLFTEKRTQIQSRFPQMLFNIYQKAKCDRIMSELCQNFLHNLVPNLKLRYSCRVFFDLLVLIFDNNFVTNQLYILTLKFIDHVRQGSSQLYHQPENASNQLIIGWLRLCKCLILKSITDNNNLKCIPEPQQKFADFLIKYGLFGEGHRFQSERCRLEAFQILSQLNPRKQIMENIGREIVPIITKGTWRKQHQWYVKSFKKRDKSAQVGLKNLAATCYINSLLQQLYHIKEFSDPLLEIDSKSIQDKENIAYQIQKIFAYLKYSNRQVYTTESLCDTFILDGQPIDPRVQMDIDEFFHTLMDKLEHNLMKIGKQGIIDDVFKGQYSNLIIGQECQHKSQRIQHFLSMRLEIIKKNSLKQALTQFIKGEVLEGENAYFCQKCNKKIKAVKRVCVKTLPEVLILTLKRFQFDFDRMEKFKLNSFCEFDEYLDMLPYMREYLYENEQKFPKEEYQYKLKGVVIHYGISEAGHYTSYARIQNGEWKYFDDDKISNFDFKELSNECFGGVDENPYSDNSEKIKNAYLLIYEKVNKNQIKKLSMNPSIKAEVDAENLNNQQIKIIFEKPLQHFFDNHFLTLGKTYLLFVHLVSLRSEHRQVVLKKCYQNCIRIFQSNPALIQWYLAQFSENLIRELVIFTIPEVSYFVASLLSYAVTKFFNPEFIKTCMKCIDRKNMMSLSKVFQAASFVPNYFKVLNQYSFGEKIMKIIKEDKTPNQGSLSKLQNQISEFGEPSTDFSERKDYRNSIQLIHCIQLHKFKGFPREDLQPFARRAKKLSTQVYLAKFVATKYRDDESFSFLVNQFIIHILLKFQPKHEEQYIYRYIIILMAKLCDIKDEQSRRRAATIAEIYLHAMKQCFEGYKAMRLLLSGLFSLCFNNDLVREEFINLLGSKDNKKYVKFIRDWMKEADKFYNHVKMDKMGYWKRVGRSSFATLERMDSDIKVTPQRYLSLFNSLIERHNVEFTDIYSPIIKKGEKILLSEFAEEEYEVIDKFGIVLLIKSEANERFILEDDAYPLRSV